MKAATKTKKASVSVTPKKSDTPKKTVKSEASEKKISAKTAASAKKVAAPAKEAATSTKATPAKKAATSTKATPAKKVATPAKKTATSAKATPVKKAVAPIELENAPVKHTVHRKLKLTKTQKKKYVDILMKLRAEYLSQLQFHQDDALSSKKDAAGERAGMATHMADLGSDNFRHDLELSLLSDEGDVIVMIDEALQKIKDSEYGICIECGCEISPARLEAKPYARFCTKCKSLHEKMEDPARRHR